MRDYRDPKAMAKTVREFLAAKNISLKHSESLELVSKMLGFSDWNTFSAAISNERPGINAPKETQDISKSEPASSYPDAAKFVGYYKQDGMAPLRIYRERERFFCQMTAQPPVEIFQESEVKFSSKSSYAQITFVLDAVGEVTELIMNETGYEQRWVRVDDKFAEGLISTLERRIKFNQPQAGSERALVNLISGIASGQPDYNEMEPGQALAIRDQLATLHPLLTEAGELESVRFIGVQNDGFDTYHAQHPRRTFRWIIGIDPDSNKIVRTWMNAGG